MRNKNLTLRMLIAAIMVTGGIICSVGGCNEASASPMAQMSLDARKSTKKLVCDETWVSSTEKSFKVTTSNDKILADLLKHFESKATRMSTAYKQDRMGRYRETSVYFPAEMENEITAFLSKK